MNLTNLNTDLRVRDLESKFLELKTALDRRVLQIIEENPQKIIRHLKFIEEKEMTLWNENLHKHDRHSEDLEIFKNNQKQNFNEATTTLMDVRKELEEVKYKNFNLHRDLET